MSLKSTMREKQWNKRRQEAIARGEDPNGAILDEMERRKPDSYLERGWRKLRGLAPTVAEERERRERKEKEKEKEEGREEVPIGEGKGGKDGKTEEDGVIR